MHAHARCSKCAGFIRLEKIGCVSTAARLLSLTRQASHVPAKKTHCPSEPTAGERGVGRARVSLRKDRKHTRAHGAKRAKNVQVTFVRLLVRGDPKFTPRSSAAACL